MAVEINWVFAPVAPVCGKSRAVALNHQMQLTKPPGSLGLLEAIAVDFCGWQQTNTPKLERISICVFAADHGVVAEGVSAFPQAVTAQMVANFAHGGAAIAVLARQLKALFRVVNLGTVAPVAAHESVVNLNLAPATANFCQQAAMPEDILARALQAGRDYAPEEADLFAGGEMGIGNTTSAAALICALTGASPDSVVGRGTGIDDETLRLKKKVVEKGLALHAGFQDQPLELLRRLGGMEIAALVGAYLACAQRGIPSIVDGFIAAAAALVACRINPGVRGWLLFSHNSAEQGHGIAIRALQATPILNAGLRLGEGSGAALTVPLLQMALALHGRMATFADAGVSDGRV